MSSQIVRDNQLYVAVDNPDGLVEARVQVAVNDILNGRFPSAAAAARNANAPYRRVLNRARGHHPRSSNGGRPLLGDVQDLALRAYMHRQILSGHHVTSAIVWRAVNSILGYENQEQGEIYVNRRWARRFLQINPHFRRVRAQPKSMLRRLAARRAELENWFDQYQRCKAENGIQPECEWNADEGNFRIGCMNNTWVWTYSDVAEPELPDPNTREPATVIESVSASGATISPFIILKGVNIPLRWITNSLDDDATLTMSDNGWTDDMIALEWLEHFNRLTRVEDPQTKRLLLLDNHGSHLTRAFENRCREFGIIVFPLPAHFTHKMQPMDVGIYAFLKKHQQLSHLNGIYQGAYSYNRDDFLDGYRMVRSRAMKPHTIRQAWKNCGLHPFNPNVILSKLPDPVSSIPADVPLQTRPGHVFSMGDGDDAWGTEEWESSSDEEGDGESSPTSSFMENHSTGVHDIERRSIIELGSSSPVSQTPGTPSPVEGTTIDLTRSSPPSTPTPRRNWPEATTPPMDVRVMGEYSQYVRYRLETSTLSGLPITPTVNRVQAKYDKTARAMAINSSTASDELQRLRESLMRRQERSTLNTLVGRTGPIRVGDARLREANVETRRQARVEEQTVRVGRHQDNADRSSLRAWLARIRSNVLKKNAKVPVSFEWPGHAEGITIQSTDDKGRHVEEVVQGEIQNRYEDLRPSPHGGVRLHALWSVQRELRQRLADDDSVSRAWKVELDDLAARHGLTVWGFRRDCQLFESFRETFEEPFQNPSLVAMPLDHFDLGRIMGVVQAANTAQYRLAEGRRTRRAQAASQAASQPASQAMEMDSQVVELGDYSEDEVEDSTIVATGDGEQD